MKKNLNMTFRVPNSVLVDQDLQLTAKVILVTLYSCCDRNRSVTKSIRSIAGLAGLSTRCVLGGLRALEASGYIRTKKYKVFDRINNRVINATSSYFLSKNTKCNYTKMPRAIFDRKNELTPADFCVAAYLHMLGAQARRAFPSKAQIAAALGIAKSTVAVTLAKISAGKISTLLLQHCRRARGNHGGDYAANSYFVVIVIAVPVERSSRIVGHRPRRKYKPLCRVYQSVTSPWDRYGQIVLCLDTKQYRRRRHERQYREVIRFLHNKSYNLDNDNLHEGKEKNSFYKY